MSLFSWFLSTSRKSISAALIQSVFESLSKGGLFNINPSKLANRIVENATTIAPFLLKTNKYISATVALTMTPTLRSLTQEEKEASRHALGVLLKYIFELQISNSISLTTLELDLLEKSKQFFLNTTSTHSTEI